MNVLFFIGSTAVLRCLECKLQFQYPLPDQAVLDKIYENYYSTWNLEHSASTVSAMKNRTFKGFLERLPLPNTTDSTGKLLDVGCATGELLTVARSYGFDVFGVEISPQGKTVCSDLFGEEKILGKSLEHGDFPSNYFDIVTLSDVIEHIPDPRALLNILADILKPHGLLLIVTPNSASWTQKLLGRHWPHYKPEHLYYFNSRNLALISSDHFHEIIVEKAYKVLNLNYLAGILLGYARNRTEQIIGWLLKQLPAAISQHNFKVHAGEMLIIFRKNC